MQQNHAVDGICAMAASYALGVLEETEAAAFRAHLSDGCASCEEEMRTFEETVAMIGFSAVHERPSPQVKERLMAAIRHSGEDSQASPAEPRKAVPEPAESFLVVRAGDGNWEPVGLPGVSVKKLYYDRKGDALTVLLRLDPGAVFPKHRHGIPEQCLVVEGDVRIGGTEYLTGDYMCAAGGSVHEVVHTQNGCVLLIIASPHDEMMV